MRRILSTACAIAVIGILAGCTSQGTSDEAMTGGTRAPQADAPFQVAESEMAGPAAGDSLSSEADVEARSIITTGFLSVTVGDPLDAADEVVRIVEQVGGRVDDRTEQPVVDGRDSSAQLTIRVPSSDLSSTIDRIEALGDVRQSSLSNSDVTSTVQDLDARITALSRSVDRLLELLETATSTDDLIAIEGALSQRQADLESLEAQRRFLGDQVDLATMSVELVSTSAAPTDPPDDFSGGLATGWSSLVAFARGALVAAGVLLPWFAVGGVIALVVVLLLRIRRLRRVATVQAEGESERFTDSSGRMDE